MKLRVCSDPEEAEQLWRSLWAGRGLFDLWKIRMCFQQTFRRPIHFIVAESHLRPAGILALSWIQEENGYACFPGETWKGRTWLEQNRIPAGGSLVREAMWEAAPENTEVRYLHPEAADTLPEVTLDEEGFLFYPQDHGYDFSSYWALFSHKSRKQIRREIEKFEAMGSRYHLDQWDDIAWMFEMSLGTLKEYSYFYDPRFAKGFEAMLSFLAQHQMLRVTTIRIGGRRAAVDVGAVFRNRYVVLGGATDPEFLGIAKMINLFHMEWACTQRFEQIDFLCGDFGWKRRFHLQSRPLYRISRPAPSDVVPMSEAGQGVVFAEV
jgi:Acetyltransferase (GNAT) domain